MTFATFKGLLVACLGRVRSGSSVEVIMGGTEEVFKVWSDHWPASVTGPPSLNLAMSSNSSGGLHLLVKSANLMIAAYMQDVD